MYTAAWLWLNMSSSNSIYREMRRSNQYTAPNQKCRNKCTAPRRVIMLKKAAQNCSWEAGYSYAQHPSRESSTVDVKSLYRLSRQKYIFLFHSLFLTLLFSLTLTFLSLFFSQVRITIKVAIIFSKVLIIF